MSWVAAAIIVIGLLPVVRELRRSRRDAESRTREVQQMLEQGEMREE